MATETTSSFRIDRLGGIANVLTAVKAPCRVATTAPITLIGLQTIDGVAVLAGNRVLVKDQGDAKQNGIYIASASDWVRPADLSRLFTVLKGTRVLVTEGTTQAWSEWVVSSDNNNGFPVPGQHEMGFSMLAAQVDSFFQPLDSDLTSIAALSTTSFGRSLLTRADAAAAVATLTAVGQGKHTIWIPAIAMSSRTTNGAATGSAEMATNKNMFKTLDFDTATQEFAQFEIHLPKSWNLGTVTFQPVWSHAATVTNFGVAWGLGGVARSDDDAGDVAFGTAQTSVDTGGTTNDIYIGAESSAITIAGTPAAGDTVQFQINRTVADGGDTMAIDARLHGVRLFYTVNAATDS